MEHGLRVPILAIDRILSSGASALVKIIWTPVILALPFVGFIVWLIAGPRGGRSAI